MDRRMVTRSIGGLVGVGLLATASANDVLLIPDSANDRIWAFSPVDGSLVDDDFIPADGNMVQPINAVASGRGTILVSDENADAILEYAIDGSFLGVVAGPDQGLDALQGLTVRDGMIYVGSRTANAIYRISLDGSSVVAWADESVGTPRDIVFRVADALISNSASDPEGENIERFGLDGVYIETFHDSDGVTGIDFPQQLQLLPDGSVLAAGFSPPNGLYVFDSEGAQTVAYTNIVTSPRGVYMLDNGQILYAGGTRVMRYDPPTQMEETIINESGTSFRYIERVSLPLACPGDVNGGGTVDVDDLVAVILAWGPCDACPEDIDDSGEVDVDDLITVILEWGPCE